MQTGYGTGKTYGMNFVNGLLNSYSYKSYSEDFSSSTRMSGQYETGSDYNGLYRIDFSYGRYSGYYYWSDGETKYEEVDSPYLNGYTFNSGFSSVTGWFKVVSNDIGWWYQTISAFTDQDSGLSYYFSTDFQSGEKPSSSSVRTTVSLNWMDTRDNWGQTAISSITYLYGSTEYIISYSSVEKKVVTVKGWNPYTDNAEYVSLGLKIYTINKDNGSISSQSVSGGSFYLNEGIIYPEGPKGTSNPIILDDTQFIGFLINNVEYYYSHLEQCYYETFPELKDNKIVYISNTDSSNENDRSFYCDCNSFSYSTSNAGSFNGRIFNNGWIVLYFNMSGQLEYIKVGGSSGSKIYTTGNEAKILGIKAIAGQEENHLGNQGAIFANGYLIKDTCNLL